MPTSYRGMYLLDANGKPSDIQVASPGGHSIPLPIEEYESRGVLPDWRELPTEKQHKALSAAYKHEQDASAFINTANADECESRGWLESVGKNNWRLTEVGK